MASEFPESWQLLPLDECMAAIIDYRGTTPTKSASGVPLITAKIVKGGRILDIGEYIPFEDFDTWMRRGMPEPGDVVVTTEAPLGEVAQLDDRKVALAQRLITLRGRPDLLDNTYLKFAMQSAFVQEQLGARATGTTVIGIKQRELRKILIPIPPLAEQQRIATILGVLDGKIELNRRMNKTLEALARALFQSWFLDFDPVRAKAEGRQPAGMDAETAALFPEGFEDSEIGDIPAGWRVSTIGAEVDVVGGSTPSTSEPAYWEGGDICWATPKDLAGLQAPVLLYTARLITEAGLNQISSGLLPVGTVLLSSRAPVGYLAIAEVPLAINQGFIAMRCSRQLPNSYVLNWAQANMEVIEGRANGTTFMEVSKSNFRTIPVIVPPIEILLAFQDIVGTWYSKLASNLRESWTLAETRDALLPRLMSGRAFIHLARSTEGGL